MIGIICAMSEEKDALLKLMKDVKIKKSEKLFYHGQTLNNEYHLGKIDDKDVVLVRSGVGEVYATIVCVKLIEKFKPELIINLGCAGSLNENVHLGDTVVADRVADWEFDVPGWDRSITSDKISFAADKRALSLIKKTAHIFKGPVVSSNTFIRKKSQLKEIKRYYPTALCGEMEGSAIGATCYAHNVPFCVIRSISDEALVQNDYKNFDFNYIKACDNAAKIAVRIILKY